jgi:ketosteroid isomerase-like protein
MTQQQQQNIDLVKGAYADFGSGNISALLDRMDDGITWETPAPRDVVPFGGTWNGKDGVGRFFSALAETLEFDKFEPQEFIASEDAVVAIGVYSARVRANNAPIGDEGFAMVFRIRDGKVVAFREYTDSLRLVAAVGAQPANAGA